MRTLKALRKHHALGAIATVAWVVFALHTLGLGGGRGTALLDTWLYGGLLAFAAAACLAKATATSEERLPGR
jgi:hypothetical protein